MAISDQLFHARSISMPSRSHPIAPRVEEELRKLRICAAEASSSSYVTSQMLCDGLQGLGDFYHWIEELLHLPGNQKALSHPHQRKMIEEELDDSIRLLDLCTASRDYLVLAKDHVQDLQSAFRRNGATMQRKVNAFIHLRKKQEKKIKNCFKTSKQIGKNTGSRDPTNDHKDCDLLSVIWLLMEARELTISLFQSISSYLSVPKPRQKTSRWSLVSNALQKKKIACKGDNEDGNGMKSLDASFLASCKDLDVARTEKAQHQLQTLEAGIEGVEIELECLFRRLIQNRVSLLNIISV